jgi:hypothetical protein
VSATHLYVERGFIIGHACIAAALLSIELAASLAADLLYYRNDYNIKSEKSG